MIYATVFCLQSVIISSLSVSLLPRSSAVISLATFFLTALLTTLLSCWYSTGSRGATGITGLEVPLLCGELVVAIVLVFVCVSTVVIVLTTFVVTVAIELLCIAVFS